MNHMYQPNQYVSYVTPIRMIQLRYVNLGPESGLADLGLNFKDKQITTFSLGEQRFLVNPK